LADVLTALPVRALLVGPSVDTSRVEQSTDVSNCERGRQWQWDNVTFTVLHPGSSSGSRASRRSGNDSSCVLHIRGAFGTALLTGDIESDAEGQLLDHGLSPASIVVAPHHGSDTSSNSLFVAATRPDVTIFSTGYRNRWNFPRPTVVERWREAGARTCDTGASVAISVTFAPHDAAVHVQVREQRHTQRRYWTRQ